MFFSSNRRAIRRTYWAVAILLILAVVVYSFQLVMRNPEWDIFAGDQARAEFASAMRPFRAEMGRLGDFAGMFEILEENWPYFEAAERAGYDVEAIAYAAFELLLDEAFGGVGERFLWEFMEQHFFGVIPRFGDLRIVSEPAALAEWLSRPYFFGAYDWRFGHDAVEVPMADEPNFTYVVDGDIVSARVRSFLPHGYAPITREPYWNFMWDYERQRLEEFFGGLDGVRDLVIDIRGNADGFRDYFYAELLPHMAAQDADIRYYVEHTGGAFAQHVLMPFIFWYGFHEGDGVLVPPTASVNAGDFDGQVWVIVCDGAFSGPNHAYMALAQAAGVNIVLDDGCDCETHWGTSFIRLRYSGLNLRFNPLMFTWEDGRLFEEYPAVPGYTLEGLPSRIRESIAN